ncbi:MAG: trehalose-phosphatase [Gemmatimonadales bacterium]
MTDPLAYFLDIDGTLIDFRDSPASVSTVAAQRHALARLRRRAGGALAIVTGRSIADVDRIFHGTQVAVAGQHGSERRTARGRYSRIVTGHESLVHVRDHLAEVVTRHPGLLLEDKGASLALHYRRMPSLAGYAHRLVRAQLATVGDAFCVQVGKRVVELKPAGRDKGMAVFSFMREPPFRGRRPVFVGDDATDEFAFEMVNALGGVSVKVGAGATAASVRLAGVAAVWKWLERFGAHPNGNHVRRAAPK